jgi:hypothetical protein
LPVAWGYVVLMLAVVEASGPRGSVLGAIATVLLYGVLPLGLVLYIGGTGRRRRAARAAQDGLSDRIDPGRGGEAAGLAVAPVREEA